MGTQGKPPPPPRPLQEAKGIFLVNKPLKWKCEYLQCKMHRCTPPPTARAQRDPEKKKGGVGGGGLNVLKGFPKSLQH